jgi:hypothetical protein
MTQHMQDLAAEIVRLQAELDREIEARRSVLGARLHEVIGDFEHGIVDEHRKLRLGMAAYFGATSPTVVMTAPVIYSLIVPIMIIDLWVSGYQAICLRAYKIPRVKRSDYIAFDRRRLKYLNLIQQLNCDFCAYANGVVAYVREISSLTEQYWCPIKHAVKISDPHRRYFEFLEYGDAQGYRDRLNQFREALRKEPPRTYSDLRA